MVDCINGLCNVLTLEEYDKLNVITPNTFFTRYTTNKFLKSLSYLEQITIS